MEIKPKYRLFEVTGIELEYMIVDRDSLKIKSIADTLMSDKAGSFVADIENGDIEWSNELVNHLIELKTHLPVKKLNGLSASFHENICEINALLERHQAMLLPTASHPFMDPDTETVLWKHDYSEIYDLYNKIFDCRGHGWSNLQSMHINLPFCNDDEFAQLHAAIRLILPIIPAISASSPLLEGKPTGWADSRMEAYLHHQETMPSLMGKLIPEAVFSEDEYQIRIFNQIQKDIAAFDHQHVMSHHFLNSRGAIARFDRGAIEIRVIDSQECPAADVAIAALITEVLKLMVKEHWAKTNYQSFWHENDLFSIFNDVIRNAENTIIHNTSYLRMFGIGEKKISAKELWHYLFNSVIRNLKTSETEILKFIIGNGSLSSRIMKRLNNHIHSENIIEVYRELSVCLNDNKMFRP
ncbi:MAG TPA: glutamate-cysteine ligase family protein [Bacteroidales bacterium]|nr:glutamate-cysteine ligase family protein [Bacteroidales bacterium]